MNLAREKKNPKTERRDNVNMILKLLASINAICSLIWAFGFPAYRNKKGLPVFGDDIYTQGVLWFILINYVLYFISVEF